MTDKALIRVLKREVDRSGLSMNEISKRAGRNPGLLHSVLTGQSRSPRLDTLEAIARVLNHDWPAFTALLERERKIMRAEEGVGVDAAMLAPAHDESPIEEHVRLNSPWPKPPERPLVSPSDVDPYGAVPVPPRQNMPRDVPVYGVAAGADGAATFNLEWGSAVDYVARPPGIAHVRSAFAMYVANDSMEPRYFRSELVYLNPRRPAAPGDFVVVVLRSSHPGEPPPCFLKRLLRRTTEAVTVEQYNPREQVSYPTAQVDQVIKVIPWDEVLGI